MAKHYIRFRAPEWIKLVDRMQRMETLLKRTDLEVSLAVNIVPKANQNPRELGELFILTALDAMQDFVNNKILPIIKAEYERALKTDEFVHRIGSNNIAEHPVDARYRDGFDKGIRHLMTAAMHWLAEASDDEISMGIAPIGPMAGLKSSNYNAFTKGSNEKEFNTWFMAVEFGTGVYAAPEIRVVGVTKDPRDPGAWWLRWKDDAGDVQKRRFTNEWDVARTKRSDRMEAEAKEAEDFWKKAAESDAETDSETASARDGSRLLFGAKMFGQKGLGVFFDPMQGDLKDSWVQLLSEEFPKFLTKKLRAQGINTGAMR